MARRDLVQYCETPPRLGKQSTTRAAGRPGRASFARDLFAGCELHRIAYTAPLPFIGMNPSIYFDGEVWRCMVRCINYRLGSQLPRTIVTKTTMLELNPHRDWRVECEVRMVDRATRPPPVYRIRGYEDARLFGWRGGLWASATCCDLTSRGNRELVLLELGADYGIDRVIPLRGTWSAVYQKNWIPRVADRDELQFIYSIDRGIVLTVVGDPPRVSELVQQRGKVRGPVGMKWTETGGLRGSSQAMALPDGTWLFLAHDRQYRSQFVRVDPTMKLLQWTPAFYFRVAGIEFSAGCAIELKNDRVVASFSVNDETTELALIPISSIMSTMLTVR